MHTHILIKKNPGNFTFKIPALHYSKKIFFVALAISSWVLQPRSYIELTICKSSAKNSINISQPSETMTKNRRQRALCESARYRVTISTNFRS